MYTCQLLPFAGLQTQMYVHAAVAVFFHHSPVYCFYEYHSECLAGADPEFLERGFICIKVRGFALMILSHLS